MFFFSDAVVRKINTRLLNVERAFINLEPILQANPLQRLETNNMQSQIGHIFYLVSHKGTAHCKRGS